MRAWQLVPLKVACGAGKGMEFWKFLKNFLCFQRNGFCVLGVCDDTLGTSTKDPFDTTAQEVVPGVVGGPS